MGVIFVMAQVYFLDPRRTRVISSRGFFGSHKLLKVC